MPEALVRPASDADYDADLYLWTQQQAARLRQAAQEHVNAPIDWENVAEEIESLGKSDKRAVESLVQHILVHLLKLAASPASEPREGWRKEIRAARKSLERVLRDSPSLRARLQEFVAGEWSQAVDEVAIDLEQFRENADFTEAFTYLKSAEAKAHHVIGPFFPEPGEVAWPPH